MIFNLDSLHYVARRPVWALAWRDRLRGMIGRRFEPEGIDAMIFPRCNAIHTMWMSIPIDVVFLDADAEVAGLCAGLKPWRLPVSCRRTAGGEDRGERNRGRTPFEFKLHIVAGND